MGFDYNRSKHNGHGDSMWTSYSDLFLGLSIVFLLLYVTASLKQGTDGVRQHAENQKLVKETEDMRQQIKVYETLKQDYLSQQASKDEQSTYTELMDKLTLLQDQQTQEKDKLREQANENEKKAVALNKYQQLIRNIINSNMIAKSRIKSRDNMINDKDEVITEKNDTIVVKNQEITGLESTVQAKEKQIEKGENQISGLKSQLDTKMKQLKNAYIAHKMTKEKYEQQEAQLKADADSKINSLRAVNAQTEQELQQASNELKQTSNRLASAQGQVQKLGEKANQLSGELANADAKHKGEVEALKGDFAAAEAKQAAQHQSEVDNLKNGFAAAEAKQKGDFEKQLAKERLSGDAKAAREAKFKADAEARAKELGDKVAGLNQKYKDSQGQLAKANENLNARKNLASQIMKNFEKAGVKAEVDPGTGDVLLSFGDQYFDTGHADLKPKMAAILNQAMPAYSQSLFENDKVAQKIQSVEIVGFASPTYKGKYIDPASLDPDNRQAVNYNLDLSYARARSIFNYVFDKNKIAFKNQGRMLPLVKVTGRSFLASDNKRDPAAAASTESFCRSNDCAKLQKVIIKFTLKD